MRKTHSTNLSCIASRLDNVNVLLNFNSSCYLLNAVFRHNKQSHRENETRLFSYQDFNKEKRILLNCYDDNTSSAY